MRRIGLLSLLYLSLCSITSGQTIVTNAIFPKVGDTLHYAVDDQTADIIITPPDFVAQNWDFSGLHQTSAFDIIMEDAQTGPEYQAFPSAQLFYTSESNRTYLEVNTQNVTDLGYKGDDPLALGVALGTRLNFIYRPGLVLMRAPVQFFDIKLASTGLLTAFPSGIFPAASQLPFVADSFRIRISISRLDAIDAFGNLTIPGGTFEVLREKRTRYTERRLDAKIAPLGWLDVTDLTLLNFPTAYLGVDTLVTYHFWSDQSKEPIAICFTDRSQLRVVKVQYKKVEVLTNSESFAKEDHRMNVFPNPVTNVIHLSTADLPAGNYAVAIYNQLGQKLLYKAVALAPGIHNLELTTDVLVTGTYFCTVSNAFGLSAHARFVKK